MELLHPILWSCLEAIAGVAIAGLVWVWLHRFQERDFAKGPPSWPLLGAALSHASNLHRFHDYITDYCRKYRTFRVAYPGFDYYYTADPANVEYMLKTNFHNYVKGEFSYEKQQEFLGDGIFSVDGLEWKRQRKVASYEFASRALRELSELSFRDQAIKLANLLVLEAKDKKSVDLQDVFLRLTFDSFCKIGFGVEMGSLLQNPSAAQQSLSKAFDNCNANVFLRYIDPLWKLKRWLHFADEARFAENVATLDRIVFELIDQRRKELREVAENTTVKADLLSRFLALSETDPEEYTDKKVRDIIINFMIAGRDTTALTLSWFFYSLCENPGVEEKLVQEILRVDSEAPHDDDDSNVDLPSEKQIGRFAKLLTYDKLSNMHYMQACLQETLRLYPAVPHDSKIAVAADTFPDGTKVRKGDSINLSPYSMGRMEWLWGEDALQFKPERFIVDGVCQHESPFKFSAFMAGPRICLGKEFAFLQMKVTIAILLRFFHFKIVPGHKVHYRIMLTLHMSKDGLKVKILPRSRIPISS